MSHRNIGIPSAALLGIPAAIILALSSIVWLMGSENPETPAGEVGYVTRGAVIGQSEFVKTQRGPTSTGRGWLLNVQNVSITPYTFSEAFVDKTSVLTKDKLDVEFQAHVVLYVEPTQVKAFVEEFSTPPGQNEDIVQATYRNMLREPIRTAVRDEVQALDAMVINEHITEVSKRLTAWAQEYVKGTPFRVKEVVVGNIQFPQTVTDSIAEKLATTQKLETARKNVEVAQQTALALTEKAKGEAEAARLIEAKLTPLYVQNRAVDAMEKLASKENTTVVYIPVGANGVPIVRAQ
jgi:regulator of protease activity HflC (stomatin/prohibitin superfamily)